MLRRGKRKTQLAAVSCSKSSSRSRRSSKTIQRSQVKWAVKGERCCDVDVIVIVINTVQCYSSTKANGFSELGVRDKQGFIENELVSTRRVNQLPRAKREALIRY